MLDLRRYSMTRNVMTFLFSAFVVLLYLITDMPVAVISVLLFFQLMAFGLSIWDLRLIIKESYL